MPRCGRAAALLLVVLIGLALPGTVSAADNATALFTEARARETALRRDVNRRVSPGPDEDALIERARTLVGAYEDISKLFPRHAVADDALWQGANLASYAFWEFGDAIDRTLALRLFSALATRFPTSTFTRGIPPETSRLQGATATVRSASPRATTATPPAPLPAPPGGTVVPPVSVAAAPPPTPSRGTTGPGVAVPAASLGPRAHVMSIRREVLPDAVRITVELDGETAYLDEMAPDRTRFALRLANTAPAPALANVSQRYLDDVVREIAVAPPTDGQTRVDLRLSGAGDHSVYALYNPYRVVVDVTRRPGTTATAATRPSATLPSASKNAKGGFSLSRQLGLGVARLVIDPGHGGHDPGTMRGETSEAALVLDIALRLERLLAQRQPDIDVVLTRRNDAFVPLERRTALAVRENADLFLSIHVNASEDTRARGIETYYLNFAPNPAAEAIAARENAASERTMGQLGDIIKAIALTNKVDESRDFAAFIQSALVDRLAKSRAVKNLGVKQAPFMVLVGATMPSALAEISFLTNDDDAAALTGAVYRQQVAEALYAGIVRYQKSLKSAPRPAAARPVASAAPPASPVHD